MAVEGLYLLWTLPGLDPLVDEPVLRERVDLAGMWSLDGLTCAGLVGQDLLVVAGLRGSEFGRPYRDLGVFRFEAPSLDEEHEQLSGPLSYRTSLHAHLAGETPPIPVGRAGQRVFAVTRIPARPDRVLVVLAPDGGSYTLDVHLDTGGGEGPDASPQPYLKSGLRLSSYSFDSDPRFRTVRTVVGRTRGAAVIFDAKAGMPADPDSLGRYPRFVYRVFVDSDLDGTVSPIGSSVPFEDPGGLIEDRGLALQQRFTRIPGEDFSMAIEVENIDAVVVGSSWAYLWRLPGAEERVLALSWMGGVAEELGAGENRQLLEFQPGRELVAWAPLERGELAAWTRDSDGLGRLELYALSAPTVGEGPDGAPHVGLAPIRHVRTALLTGDLTGEVPVALVADRSRRRSVYALLGPSSTLVRYDLHDEVVRPEVVLGPKQQPDLASAWEQVSTARFRDGVLLVRFQRSLDWDTTSELWLVDGDADGRPDGSGLTDQHAEARHALVEDQGEEGPFAESHGLPAE